MSFKHGRKTVERFLDAVLAIEEHIDPYFFIKRDISVAEEKRRAEHRVKDGPYDDLWFLDKSGARHSESTSITSTTTSRASVCRKKICFTTS